MTGEQASTEDLLNVAKRFEDELTLDNLSRPQLVSMCRYMNINAFGTDNFLRFQIRNRMRQIKADDKVIQNEGIETLTIQELQNACASRGIRSVGTSPGRLRDELAQWLELHIDHHVPGTLLILSRAFSYTDRGMTTEEALRATFNSLPDNLVNEAELQVLEQVGASTYKQKLDVLEQQQELIEDESEQEEKEEKARLEAAQLAEEARLEAEKKEREEAEKKDAFVADEPTVSDEQVDKKEEKKTEDKQTSTAAAEPQADTTKAEEEPLSAEQQSELQDALTKLRTKVNVLEERAQFNEIKIQHEDYKEVKDDELSVLNCLLTLHTISSLRNSRTPPSVMLIKQHCVWARNWKRCWLTLTRNWTLWKRSLQQRKPLLMKRSKRSLLLKRKRQRKSNSIDVMYINYLNKFILITPPPPFGLSAYIKDIEAVDI